MGECRDAGDLRSRSVLRPQVRVLRFLLRGRRGGGARPVSRARGAGDGPPAEGVSRRSERPGGHRVLRRGDADGPRAGPAQPAPRRDPVALSRCGRRRDHDGGEPGDGDRRRFRPAAGRRLQPREPRGPVVPAGNARRPRADPLRGGRPRGVPGRPQGPVLLRRDRPHLRQPRTGRDGMAGGPRPRRDVPARPRVGLRVDAGTRNPDPRGDRRRRDRPPRRRRRGPDVHSGAGNLSGRGVPTLRDIQLRPLRDGVPPQPEILAQGRIPRARSFGPRAAVPRGIRPVRSADGEPAIAARLCPGAKAKNARRGVRPARAAGKTRGRSRSSSDCGCRKGCPRPPSKQGTAPRPTRRGRPWKT